MKQTKPFITAQQHIQGRNHKRFFFITIALLFILITNTAFTAISDEQEPLLVRVGAYANNPKIFMNANGKVAGFWPDLIEDIAKRENWKIEYVWGTWSERLEHLINKEIDIMPDVAFTEKRNKLYAFSESSVLMSWARMYLNKENMEKESIGDLKNKKIAVLKGSANLEGIGGLREIALRFNLNCTFLELDTYKEVFKAVEENRADAGITNRNFGNKNAEFFKIKKTPVIFQPITIKFAFPKDAELTPYLVEKINYHIKKFKQDEHSVYYQLLKKYFETEIAEKTIEVFPVWLGTALKGITALFLFFIAVIIVSRIQVKRKTNEIILKNKMLQRSEEQYRAIYNAPSDAIFIHDASTGKIVDVNRAMLDMYGYNYEEVMQLEVAVFSSGKHHYTRKQAGELLNKAVTDGPQTFEWQARKKNGEVFWVEVSLKYYKIQDTGYVVAIVRDSTDRKRKALEKANMEYAAANKELKEFAYIVSHDL
nr:transporter substrate-binding domain-containing protein [Desulfobacterales bacterium]